MYICIIIGDGPLLMGLSVTMHPRPSQDGQMFYTKVLPKEGLPPCLSSMPPLPSRQHRDTRLKLVKTGHVTWILTSRLITSSWSWFDFIPRCCELLAQLQMQGEDCLVMLSLSSAPGQVQLWPTWTRKGSLSTLTRSLWIRHSWHRQKFWKIEVTTILEEANQILQPRGVDTLTHIVWEARLLIIVSFI